MDPIKTGALIREFRMRAGLTQKALAERLHISDKAVSKWECGNGSPDLALLPELAAVFGTDMQTLCSGSIEKNEKEKGNMKHMKFYVCAECGNIVTAASETAVNCCGRRLDALTPKKAAPEEKLRAEEIDGEWYITAAHPMTKAHHITFAAYIGDSTAMIFRQYPEWDFQVRMPLVRSGRLVWYCGQCGLLYQDF